MSVNKYSDHIVILPEDKANSEIANGFLLHPLINQRSISVLKYVGGWKVVIDKFERDHADRMRKYQDMRIMLLIDFDGDPRGRFDYVTGRIPTDLKDRVFVIGVQSEPEELRIDLGKGFEAIGETLSNDCFDNNLEGLWGHELLKHNRHELERLITSVKPFIFISSE